MVFSFCSYEQCWQSYGRFMLGIYVKEISSFVSLSLPGDGRVVWPCFHGILLSVKSFTQGCTRYKLASLLAIVIFLVNAF